MGINWYYMLLACPLPGGNIITVVCVACHCCERTYLPQTLYSLCNPCCAYQPDSFSATN